jgi:dolichol-phosphate mannosyltransferase
VIYVIFPAYNEEESIGPALAALGQAMAHRIHEVEAVLVNDGSTDRTVEAAEAGLEKSIGLMLHVLWHGENLGLGAGLRTGLYWCLDRARDDDVIVTLDADNTHPPSLIPRMLIKLDEGNDLVIASRYEPGAVVRGVPPHRRALSDLSRFLFKAMFPIRGARDYTCCFRAYRVPLLRQARLVYGEEFCTARGFEAVMDILLRLRQLDVRVAEVPLTLEYEKRAGRSKMQVLRTMRRTLTLLGVRFVERFGRYSKGRVRARLAEARAPQAPAAA